jgi:hypothetical protein
MKNDHELERTGEDDVDLVEIVALEKEDNCRRHKQEEYCLRGE